MGKISFDAMPATQTTNSNRVEYFSLKNDGDEAVVRILHDTTDSFDIFACHKVKINNKDRFVNCLRNPKDPVEKCPFCYEEEKLSYVFYIHLIEYVTGENGEIVPVPKIWQRSMSYANTIKNLITEYGTLSDIVFKIKRNGAAGSRDTTYSIMMANPNVYRSDLYPKVDLFGNYKVLGGAVLDKSAEDMEAYLATGSFPTPNSQATPKTVDNTVNTTPDETIDTSYNAYQPYPKVETRQAPPWNQQNNNWGNPNSVTPNRRY